MIITVCPLPSNSHFTKETLEFGERAGMSFWSIIYFSKFDKKIVIWELSNVLLQDNNIIIEA